MTVKRFVTKRVKIEAMQWRYNKKLLSEMYEFTEGNFRLRGELDSGVPVGEWTAEVFDKLHDTWIGVKDGQWIVRGAKGEYYPCDDETFHWKYEEVESFKADPFMVAQIEYKFFKEDWREQVKSPNEIRKANGMEER